MAISLAVGSRNGKPKSTRLEYPGLGDPSVPRLKPMSSLRPRIARRALLYWSLAVLPLSACFEAGLGTGTGIPGAGGATPRYTVEYTASISGDGTIAEVRYLNPEGLQILALDPVLPFSIEFTMGSGDVVGITAAGDATTGGLQIGLHAVRTNAQTPTPFLDLSDSCQSDGDFIICELSIPSQSL